MQVAPDKLQYENRLWQQGLQYVAGVDEAGRGPLAGPVVAAAIMFPPGESIPGVDDSKKLTPRVRAELYPLLIERCTSYAVSIVNADEIDRLNILQATILAMQRAIAGLAPRPEHVLIDGRPLPGCQVPQTAIIKGDALSFTIGAASILAKVVRDEIMGYYHRRFPQYGFNQHKGYGTVAHLAALKKLGPCAIHRRSFKPRRSAGME
ncbi:MAG: ribonuclease HII [candidate division KSB1 bacterium]|nr:ribonuclease HII [candidate division KSB1 bacterium]MDZ7274693.1 ribonuclease HII [candidate division KSB1 bacterium]MDZ7285518.1 ribonuclease HII [candidate division KSB1 bacterium]MDZ7298550.1 ribonuclease HII [candidate division KSB1 bacterium]MDZ7306598.1 ribonuclease HII [candidate division KSB1 bacterium]